MCVCVRLLLLQIRKMVYYIQHLSAIVILFTLLTSAKCYKPAAAEQKTEQYLDRLWSQFKQTHNKLYSDDFEEAYRYRIYYKIIFAISRTKVSVFRSLLTQPTYIINVKKLTSL